MQDSGSGIKWEDRSKLFTLFGKLEQTAKINTTGIGLGLSICQQIVEALKGDIKLDDDYQNGASFTFRVKCGVLNMNEHQFESSLSITLGISPLHENELLLR